MGHHFKIFFFERLLLILPNKDVKKNEPGSLKYELFSKIGICIIYISVYLIIVNNNKLILVSKLYLGSVMIIQITTVNSSAINRLNIKKQITIYKHLTLYIYK